MNILRIVYDWPDENVITEGLAPAPYELSVSQAKLGHKIYVLCGNLNGKNIKAGKFHYSLEEGKIEVFNLPRAINKLGPFLSTSIFVLPYYFYLKASKQIDLIHNQGHLGVWLLLYKYLFGFIDRTPVLGHIHITAKGREQKILEQGKPIDFWTKYFEYPIHKMSDSLTGKVCEEIVTVGKENIDELHTMYGIDKSKITLLESGVDTKRFSRKGEINKTGFDKNDIVLGNIGRLSKRKNIDVIVESLEFLPEKYKLVLWGKWDGEFESEVQKIIKQKNLTSRVKYLGPVSYFEIDKAYRAIDLFLLPSSYEGLPKVVVEALSIGCKAIASGFTMDKDVPNMHFLDKIDAKTLADLILKVSKKPDEYDGARKVIEKYYSWDSKASDLEKIYAKIVKKIR